MSLKRSIDIYNASLRHANANSIVTFNCILFELLASSLGRRNTLVGFDVNFHLSALF
jgi:hypothetical protein